MKAAVYRGGGRPVAIEQVEVRAFLAVFLLVGKPWVLFVTG